MIGACDPLDGDGDSRFRSGRLRSADALKAGEDMGNLVAGRLRRAHDTLRPGSRQASTSSPDRRTSRHGCRRSGKLVNGPLRDNPHRVGKPLRTPFAGHWLAIESDLSSTTTDRSCPARPAYCPGVSIRASWHP